MKNQGSYRSRYIRINSENEGASLVALMVKNLAAIWETRVWFLGGNNTLEKQMATHSNNLAWRIPWTHSPWSCKDSDTTEQVTLSLRKWDFSPASWQKGRGSMCTPGAGRPRCSGRVYTGAECRGGGNVRTQGWRSRWGRASYYFVCFGLVSSLRASPGLSWGTQGECERNITSRHGCWQGQDTNLSIVSHMDTPLLLLGCFHQL